MIADPFGRLLALYDSAQLAHVVRLGWDGSRDESFDQDGITNVTFIPDTTNQESLGFTLVDGGDIVVVGRSGGATCLARLDSAGRRTGLDGDGRVCLDAGSGSHVSPFGTDGLLVTGTLNGAPAAWKVTPSGLLDTTFGDGDGMTVWTLDAGWGNAPALPLGSGFLLPVHTASDFKLVRFDSKGDLVTSFGTGGRLTFTGQSLLHATSGLGGRSILTSRKGAKRFGLVLDPTGNADPAFGDSGVIELSTPVGAVEDLFPSDKTSELFAIVQFDTAAHLARIDAHGVQDPSFGVNGLVPLATEAVVDVVPLPRSRVAVYTVDGDVIRLWR